MKTEQDLWEEQQARKISEKFLGFCFCFLFSSSMFSSTAVVPAFFWMGSIGKGGEIHCFASFFLLSFFVFHSRVEEAEGEKIRISQTNFSIVSEIRHACYINMGVPSLLASLKPIAIAWEGVYSFRA